MSPSDGPGSRQGTPSANAGATGEEASLRRWRTLVAAASVATYLLIVLGGVVRITGSGMGCGDDWPLCNGQLVPTMSLATFIEWSHRLVAGGVSLLVGVVTAWAWWPGRGSRWTSYRKITAAAAVLLIVQVLLGAVTVRLELPPASVLLHLGTALLLLAALLIGWARAGTSRRVRRHDAASAWTWTGAASAFVVVLAGGFVANLDAAAACTGFPLCSGQWWPGGGWRTHVHWGHRLLAYLLVAGVPLLALHVRSRRPGDPVPRRWTYAAGVVAVAQLGVGAALVTGAFTTAVRALHVTLGTAIFALLVVAGWTISRKPASGAG